MTTRFASIAVASGLALFLTGCGGTSGTNDMTDAGATMIDAASLDGTAADGAAVACTTGQLNALEQQMTAALDMAAHDTSITSIPDFTLMLEAEDGRAYSRSVGVSTAATPYESASTSKLVSAAVILDLVDRGFLSLDTKAHDLLPFWSETTVTLRHLLSFTSGFSTEPLCINIAAGNFNNCVQTIYTNNSANGIPAGSQFYYSSAHLQIAGLMAITAKAAAAWTDVFADFKTRTGLFANATYDLPSATNPRLAGGMHWTAQEYLAFLRALFKGQILSDASRAALFANQRGSATVAYSPTLGTSGIGEDWAYGLGNWLECPTATQPDTFNCGGGHRNSSPGAYGAYPFIDFDHHYIGILARQGSVGTYPEGIRLFRTVEDLARRWAEKDCR